MVWSHFTLISLSSQDFLCICIMFIFPSICSHLDRAVETSKKTREITEAKTSTGFIWLPGLLVETCWFNMRIIIFSSGVVGGSFEKLQQIFNTFIVTSTYESLANWYPTRARSRHPVNLQPLLSCYNWGCCKTIENDTFGKSGQHKQMQALVAVRKWTAMAVVIEFFVLITIIQETYSIN